MNKMYEQAEEDDRIFSATDLWDTAYEIAQHFIAVAFTGSKTVDGKSLEQYITDYVDGLEGS